MREFYFLLGAIASQLPLNYAIGSASLPRGTIAKRKSEFPMHTQSVFAVIHKSTKDFAFVIAAETQEQSEQTLRAHLNSNSEQYEVVETTLMFSDPFIQIQEKNVNPGKDRERGIEYCGAPSL